MARNCSVKEEITKMKKKKPLKGGPICSLAITWSTPFAGFALGATIESKTKGIWIWVKEHPRYRGQYLVLLDTEGIGDVKKVWHINIMLIFLPQFWNRVHLEYHPFSELHNILVIRRRDRIFSNYKSINVSYILCHVSWSFICYLPHQRLCVCLFVNALKTELFKVGIWNLVCGTSVTLARSRSWGQKMLFPGF